MKYRICEIGMHTNIVMHIKDCMSKLPHPTHFNSTLLEYYGRTMRIEYLSPRFITSKN
jgi:hypothetical protein